jgi:peroxiredoxin
MLAEGSPVPAVAAVGEDLERVQLDALAADGPYLLIFYLYDWTST